MCVICIPHKRQSKINKELNQKKKQNQGEREREVEIENYNLQRWKEKLHTSIHTHIYVYIYRLERQRSFYGGITIDLNRLFTKRFTQIEENKIHPMNIN